MSRSPAPSKDRRSAPGSSFRSAWTLFHIAGVPIRVDVSWLFIAALVSWIFFRNFTELLAEFAPAVVAGSAGVAALLFFASLLAHELGHAVTSLDRGVRVLGITLFLFGGVTESTTEAKTARDEFVIVGIGPFISLVLAAGFGLLHTAVVANAPLAAITGYLAWFNLVLAVFNLVPGYPLDGGRLLRSILWSFTGKPHRSTRWAARVGQAFALGLMAFGVVAFMRTGGAGLRGVWEALIGFFLFRGAADSYKRAVVRERLAGQRPEDLMTAAPPTLDPAAPLADVIGQLQERPALPWPVGDPPVGVLWLADIDDVPHQEWTRTTAGTVAQPLEGSVIGAEEPMDVVLDRMAQARGNQLLVVDAMGRTVGLLTPDLVTELLR